jgi:hypothetical protein
MRIALTIALAILPVLAAADVIHLADGTRREGRIVETTATEVVVDVGVGNVSLMVRIPRADVVRIEHKASANDRLMADFARRLSQARTADDWHAVGAWCIEQRVLKEQARAAFERAVAIDPDHAGARAALGHVKLNDAWMSRDRAVALLAPEVTEAAVRARADILAARKETEQAHAQALEAQAQLTDIQARLEQLQRENAELRGRLATPPPPPVVERERIIYRPIIIRPRPKKPSTDAGPAPKGGRRKPSTTEAAPSPKGKAPAVPEAPPADEPTDKSE